MIPEENNILKTDTYILSQADKYLLFDCRVATST